MKNVRYVGPSGTGVRITHPVEDRPRATTSVVCRPGETVQLPDQVADQHVAAGTFEAVEPDRPKRTKTAAEPTEQKEDD